MNGLINSSKSQLKQHVDVLGARTRQFLESLVFWVLGTLRDLQDALLAFDFIKGLVIYALDAKCSDVVMANVRSPRSGLSAVWSTVLDLLRCYFVF